MLGANKPKRFLFNTQFKWPYSPVDYSLAMALRHRGHDVAMVACGGLPDYCERETKDQNRPSCESCLTDIVSDFQKYNLPFYAVTNSITSDDIAKAKNISEENSVSTLLNLEVCNIPVGKLAWLNLFHYFKGYPFEISGEKEKVFRRCINSAILFVTASVQLLDRYKPDMIITVNGKFLQWSPFIYLAKQRNIAFTTWEDLNITQNGTIFAINEIAHEQCIDSVWNEESKKPLSKIDKKALLMHFKLWEEGKTTPFPYYDETTERNIDNIRFSLGLRKGVPIVTLFPNVSWDSTSVGFDSVFQNMYDWAFRVVEYARRRPDIEFVIRAHPAEKKMPDTFKSTTPICEAIRSKYLSIPTNVKLVDGQSTISSYSLADISNIVMVYTSTLGIELALKGKRPWVAARPYYSGKGFTLDLKSPQHMHELLDSNLFENNLTPKQIELAERFAHIVRFRRVFPFPYIDGFSGTFTPTRPDTFVPGANPIIDNLCNYLLTGKPFLDIGWRTICADDNLANIKEVAQNNRFGYWQVKFRGFTIYCHDILSFYMAAKDIFLNRIYDFTSSKQKPRIIDGGGHIGLFTLFVKQKYPDAQITVFEPDEESLQLLKYNLDTNGVTGVAVVKAGLYSHVGKLPFGSDHSDGSSIFLEDKNTSINVVCLSHYIDSEIDFLKLNIEGAEIDVLTEIESKLSLIKEMVIEYHGFPEIGQNLHKLLTILDRAGFRYLIHDFDIETNPATKPPFKLETNTRYFLLIYAKRLFQSEQQNVVCNQTENSKYPQPISRLFGFDRGTPIDRYYIEKFLDKNKTFIRGNVLEIGDNTYTKKYGTSVIQCDILNAVPSPNATILGNLETGQNIPKASFDCIILTQTLLCIYDVKSALRNVIKALKPEGTLLLTVPGISQISRYDMDRWGDYWRFTDKSIRTMLIELAPNFEIEVDSFGNVAVAKLFLDGYASHEVPQQIFDYKDNDYQVVITARLCKGKLLTKDKTSTITNTLSRPYTGSTSNIEYNLNFSFLHRYFEHLDSTLNQTTRTDAIYINQFLKISSYLQKSHISYAYPSIWEIETTNRCAMSCNHCPRSTHLNRELTDMDFGLLKSIINQLRCYAQNVFPGSARPTIQFIHYGEPALYRYFEDSIRYAKNKDFSVIISSTSSAFNDKAIKASVDAALDDLWLIFDGMDEKTFKNIRGKAASFNMGLEQLKKLLLYKKQKGASFPNITSIMIKHPYNRHQWQIFKNYFNSIQGISCCLAHFSTFAGKIDTINELQKAIADDPEEQIEIARVRKLNNNVCYYPWHSVSVLSDGRVVPCCRDINGDYLLGDLKNESLVDIWNGKMLQKLRQDFIKGNRNNPLCAKCNEGSLEIGVPNEVDKHGQELFSSLYLNDTTFRDIPIINRPKVKNFVADKYYTKTNLLLNGPLVLLYHRIANDPIDAQLLAVSPENFEEHLRELVENCRVIPLYQLLEEVRRDKLNADTVALTFDDGYLDNLTDAVPLLEKYGLHATIFVTSGMVGSDREFWWDMLEQIFLTGKPLPEFLTITSSGITKEWRLTTAQERLKTQNELCSILRSKPFEKIVIFIDNLLKQIGIEQRTRITHRIVNPEQLKIMADSPSIEIGSHSVTHTKLSILSPEKQRQEIREAKQQLKSIIKKPIRLFSYPYGTTDDFTEETSQIVAEEGYNAGIANIQGNITIPINLYAIPRRLVRNWTGKMFADWLKEKDKGKLEFQTTSAKAKELLNFLQHTV